MTCPIPDMVVETLLIQTEPEPEDIQDDEDEA